MTTATDIINRAAGFGIRAKLWQRGNKVRIYAEAGRKDLSVYLEIDGTPDDIQGAAFKVFCNTPQHPKWVASQERQARERFAGLVYAWVLEHYTTANGYGNDVSGMIQAAREFEAKHAEGDAA